MGDAVILSVIWFVIGWVWRGIYNGWKQAGKQKGRVSKYG